LGGLRLKPTEGGKADALARVGKVLMRATFPAEAV
jgi:hypothetical protein